jgi:hypothetical protein
MRPCVSGPGCENRNEDDGTAHVDLRGTPFAVLHKFAVGPVPSETLTTRVVSYLPSSSLVAFPTCRGPTSITTKSLH